MADDRHGRTGSTPKSRGSAPPSLREQLEERCRNAGIEFVVPWEHENAFPPVEVLLPAGGTRHCVFLFDEDELRAFLAVPFEDFVWLEPYIAFASPGNDRICALVETLSADKYRPDRPVWGQGRQ